MELSWKSVVESLDAAEERITGLFNTHRRRFVDGEVGLGTFEVESPLIDVWAGDNAGTFVLCPEDGETPICFSKTQPWRPPAHYAGEPIPSITSQSEFLNNFKIFTNNVFEGWNHWDNIVVAGSTIVACCLPIPAEYSSSDALKAHYFHEIEYKSSDIDIFFYGMSKLECVEKLLLFHDFLKAKFPDCLLVFETPNTVTFTTAYPTRHIQVILSIWVSPEELLIQPVVDCTCIAYDGKKLWATKRSRLSFNYRTLTISDKKYQIKGSPEFETRIIKYSLHGFDILSPGFSWDKVCSNSISFGTRKILEQPKGHGVIGMRFLICALRSAEVQAQYPQLFGNDWKHQGIPYGPMWDSKLIKTHFKPDGGGYYSRTRFPWRQRPLVFRHISGDVKEAVQKLHIPFFFYTPCTQDLWDTFLYTDEEPIATEATNRFQSTCYFVPYLSEQIMIRPRALTIQIVPSLEGSDFLEETYSPNKSKLTQMLMDWSRNTGRWPRELKFMYPRNK